MVACSDNLVMGHVEDVDVAMTVGKSNLHFGNALRGI